MKDKTEPCFIRPKFTISALCHFDAKLSTTFHKMLQNHIINWIWPSFFCIVQKLSTPSLSCDVANHLIRCVTGGALTLPHLSWFKIVAKLNQFVMLSFFKINSSKLSAIDWTLLHVSVNECHSSFKYQNMRQFVAWVKIPSVHCAMCLVTCSHWSTLTFVYPTILVSAIPCLPSIRF